MAQTVTQLAAAALRRIGVQAASLTADTDTIAISAIGQMALQRLGANPFGTSVQPVTTDIITQIDIASGALKMLGVNPQAVGGVPSPGGSTAISALAPRVLFRLGVYAPDETPTSPDLAVATNALAQVQAALEALSYVTWASTSIPDQACEVYITMAVFFAAPSFEKPGDVTQYQAGLEMFRLMASSGTNANNWALQMVQIVHEEQMALNNVTWALGAVPYAVGHSYMALAADAMAPAFGKPRNPPDVLAAAAQIKSVALSGVYGQYLATSEAGNLSAEVNGLGISAWATNAIPTAVADAFAVVVANRLAPLYDKARDDKAIDNAFLDIRRIALLINAQPLAETTLRELHAEWRVRDLTRWELFDIPREAEESYIAGTGARLAPQFPGSSSPPGALLGAELGIYRIISLASAGRPVQVDYF